METAPGRLVSGCIAKLRVAGSILGTSKSAKAAGGVSRDVDGVSVAE
jgi:hypothetical protein